MSNTGTASAGPEGSDLHVDLPEGMDLATFEAVQSSPAAQNLFFSLMVIKCSKTKDKEEIDRAWRAGGMERALVLLRPYLVSARPDLGGAGGRGEERADGELQSEEERVFLTWTACCMLALLFTNFPKGSSDQDAEVKGAQRWKAIALGTQIEIHVCIMSAMRAHQTKAEIQAEGCSVLSAMQSCPYHAHLFERAEGFSFVLRALKDHVADANCVKAACDALAPSVFSAQRQERLEKEGGVQAVMQALKEHSDFGSFQYEKEAPAWLHCCEALRNMARGGLSNAIAQQGGIQLVVGGMKEAMGDPFVHECGLSFLQGMVEPVERSDAGPNRDVLEAFRGWQAAAKIIEAEGGLELALRACVSFQDQEPLLSIALLFLGDFWETREVSNSLFGQEMSAQDVVKMKDSMSMIMGVLQQHKSCENIQTNGVHSLLKLSKVPQGDAHLVSLGGVRLITKAMGPGGALGEGSSTHGFLEHQIAGLVPIRIGFNEDEQIQAEASPGADEAMIAGIFRTLANKYAKESGRVRDVCGACGKTAQQAGRKILLRCGGCSLEAATYCSKECQTTCWRAHKAACRASRPQARAAGAKAADGH